MTDYTITVLPKIGSPRVEEYQDAERYSVAVNAYHASGIRIEYNPSLLIKVRTHLPRNYNYVGD